MNKLFFAIESDEIKDVVTVDAEPVETDIAQISENSMVASQLTQDAEEGEAVQETLAQMEAQPEKAAEIAKEHLLSRLMCAPNTSLESVDARVNTGVSVANEGVVARFTETIKRVFTSDEKLKKQLEENIVKLKENGPKETDIVEPGWGRVFTTGSSGVVSSSEVLKTLNELKKVTSNAEFSNFAKELEDLVDELVVKLNKSTFIASDKVVDEIEILIQTAIKIREKYSDLVPTGTTVRKDISFKPCDIKEGEQIAKTTEAILTDTKFIKASEKIAEASKYFYGEIFIQDGIRLKSGFTGMSAADVKAARIVIFKLSKILSGFNELYTDRSKLVYGAVKYIGASANGKAPAAAE